MMETTTQPFSRLRRRVTKRKLKDYCLLEQMSIINTRQDSRFVIFMIVVMNDVLKIFLQFVG